MGLREEIEKLKYDVRLMDWNVKHKVVDPAELKKHIDALPDVAANAITMESESNQNQGNGATGMPHLHS